ncbi:unnamed protein product, partial [Timema podura]|nr:unnamed protein product [Timema podura]
MSAALEHSTTEVDWSGKITLGTPGQDLNPNIPFIGGLVYCECDALNHVATELWNCLIDSREDTANKIIGLKEVKTCTNLEHNDKNSCSAKAGFQNINLALRIKLKKCNGPMVLMWELKNLDLLKFILLTMGKPKQVSHDSERMFVRTEAWERLEEFVREGLEEGSLMKLRR